MYLMDPVPPSHLMKEVNCRNTLSPDQRPSLIKDCADGFQAVTLGLQDALAGSATHPPIFMHPLTVASDLSGPTT